MKLAALALFAATLAHAQRPDCAYRDPDTGECLKATMAQGFAMRETCKADGSNCGEEFTQQGQSCVRYGNGKILCKSMPLTCDQQYALTAANLRDAIEITRPHYPETDSNGVAISIGVIPDKRYKPLLSAYDTVTSMPRACDPADIAFLTDIDAMLYRAGLALPPEQAEAKRKTDAEKEQARVKKALQDALEAK